MSATTARDLPMGICTQGISSVPVDESSRPRWERQIMEGPYIHHCSAIYDHCADALEEAVRYIPNLGLQRFDRAPA